MSDFKRFERPVDYKGEMKNIFDRLLKEGNLEGYKEPCFIGIATLNEAGRAALGIAQAEDWIRFEYMDINSSSGNDEMFYGVINPTSGEVNSTEHNIWWD